MIRIEDIKVGSVLQITKGNLYKIADSVFADKIDPLGSSIIGFNMLRLSI